ncbi:MAG: hypothetical protein OXE55_06695 [Flavobacteriaceae bacterium]|nr:hypothetical protein [Flavobacteriaceae bacterium]
MKTIIQEKPWNQKQVLLGFGWDASTGPRSHGVRAKTPPSSPASGAAIPRC